MQNAMRRIAIVGNGIAGLTAADALRAHGFDGELSIVGDEARPAYSRPALSKALLRLDADLASHELPPASHGAAERLGVAAVGLDVSAGIVHLADGTDLPYDGLVIASGSRARRLAGTAGAFVLRTLDDALAIRARIADRPDVVIVGGGPLGMEIASGAVESGCRVTLVTNRPPMVHVLGEHLGELLTAAAIARGVRILSTPNARVVERDGRAIVELADGTPVPGDVVISAVGDVSNTEWLAGSGLPATGPLPVDSRGRLSPSIVAAGDVAAFPMPSGGHARSPVWQSAIAQANVAAVALLLGDAAPELSGQPYFWTEQFGLDVRVAGRTPLAGAPEVIDGEGASQLLRWRREGGEATAVAINYRIPIPKLRRLTQPAAV